MHRPQSRFAIAILAFAPLFLKRSWRHAEVLLTGAILAPGTRTVASVLRIAGLARERRFVNYHRVLNRAAWCPRAGARLLLALLVAAFVRIPVIAIGWGPGSSAVLVLTITLLDPCRLSHHAAARTRWRSRSWLARPYMLRFSSFNRLICPSTGPVLQGSTTAASTASWSRQMPRTKAFNSVPLALDSQSSNRVARSLLALSLTRVAKLAASSPAQARSGASFAKWARNMLSCASSLSDAVANNLAQRRLDGAGHAAVVITHPPCGGSASLMQCADAAERAGAVEPGRVDRVGAAASAARDDLAHVVQAAVHGSQGAARAGQAWRGQAVTL